MQYRLSLPLVKPRLHCRSDQLDRPDRPNSPTKLDRARPIKLYTTCSQPSPLLYSRVDRAYTRPIPDHFLIASWALAYSIATRLFQSKIIVYRYRKPDRRRPPRPLPSEPDQFPIVW